MGIDIYMAVACQIISADLSARYRRAESLALRKRLPCLYGVQNCIPG